jgi:hypothetical protein
LKFGGVEVAAAAAELNGIERIFVWRHFGDAANLALILDVGEGRCAVDSDFVSYLELRHIYLFP